jgi:hypothetical protein
MWLFALLACGADRDLDGFPKSQDCDDDDPLVYPGAPDAPEDGVDGDCDGDDPPYAFLGTWTLSDIDASYFGLAALEPGSFGTLTIEDDLTATLDVDVFLAEDLIGFSLQAPIELTGEVSAVPGRDRFDALLDGELFDEEVYADLYCVVVDGGVVCAGGLKALDINFDVEAWFE